MKSTKLMLLGIVVLLVGICSFLLSGLEGMPTFDNGFFELLGVACTAVGIIVSLVGFFKKDNKD